MKLTLELWHSKFLGFEMQVRAKTPSTAKNAKKSAHEIIHGHTAKNAKKKACEVIHVIALLFLLLTVRVFAQRSR